ncbi:MAG: winged helix-turn-helix transcriptional regulator [Bacteroidota bacterium]
MELKFRCDCPITSAVDVLGDRWMLVVIKQMLLEERKTFKDFMESDEAIATNILSAKLKLLEKLQLITKSKLPNNKKTNLYLLTEKGLSLAGTIVELALWSDENLRSLNRKMRKEESIDAMKSNKEGFVESLKQAYRERRGEYGLA